MLYSVSRRSMTNKSLARRRNLGCSEGSRLLFVSAQPMFGSEPLPSVADFYRRFIPQKCPWPIVPHCCSDHRGGSQSPFTSLGPPSCRCLPLSVCWRRGPHPSSIFAYCRCSVPKNCSARTTKRPRGCGSLLFAHTEEQTTREEPFRTPSGQKCYPCLRYEPLPSCPDWTTSGVADGEGFEPPRGVNLCRFSRPVLLTAQPPVRVAGFNNLRRGRLLPAAAKTLRQGPDVLFRHALRAANFVIGTKGEITKPTGSLGVKSPSGVPLCAARNPQVQLSQESRWRPHVA